jgi:hypothetical protein
MGLAVKLSVAAGWRRGAGNICLSSYEQRKEYLSQYLTNLMHKILFYNRFYFMPLHVSSTCAHYHEVKIALHSLWYHHTYGCDDWLNSEINILRYTVSKTSKKKRKECFKSDPPNFAFLSGFSANIFRTFFSYNMPTVYTAHQIPFYVLKFLIMYQKVSKLGKCPLRTFLRLPVIFYMLQN